MIKNLLFTRLHYLLGLLFLFQVSNIFAQCSTSSTPINDCSVGDQIDEFSLDGVPTVTNFGCSPNGYQNFPVPVRTLQQGQSYSWSATVGQGGGGLSMYDQGMAIWIDINNNNIYEASEMLVSAAPALNHTGSITIPITASAASNIRMRTRCANSHFNCQHINRDIDMVYCFNRWHSNCNRPFLYNSFS